MQMESILQSDEHRDAWGQLPDDLNPAFVFALTPTPVLLAAARGELDLGRLAREQLAARGVDRGGNWVGFDAARVIHKVAK
jgi:hypothetical protein